MQESIALHGHSTGATVSEPPTLNVEAEPRSRQTRFLRRAQLVVQCALELPGVRICPDTGQIHLELSIRQFEAELRRRYGKSHPDLVFRADSTFERARLDRHRYKNLPRVILRQGPPIKLMSTSQRMLEEFD